MVTSTETIWIKMPDGARLAARLWLPEGDGPFPTILEYIPYRRRDRTRLRDEAMHPRFARAGYASIRVDMRGAGDSDGLMHGEYLEQEIQDGCDVIGWIRGQEWSDGQVGMFGKSWGAYSAYQVAARRPEGLRAIAPVMGTDDRWAECIHFSGGCLMSDNFWWGAIMQLFNAQPARSGGPGRRVARDMAGAARGGGILAGRVARASDAGCVLAAWVGVRELRRYRGGPPISLAAGPMPIATRRFGWPNMPRARSR